jgi:hypothetical protein
MGDIMDANSDIILLQLHEEHNSVMKKKMEEVIIKPVGSQHILFSLQSFVVITCEGFVLILKFVMRIY